MNTLHDTMLDSVAMFQRNMVHAIRYPLIMYMIGVPVVVLLLFVFAFGGTLGAGLPGGGGTDAYLEYIVPGIIFLAVGGAGQLAAISVAQDMTEGIIARFRSMDISRSAVMAGHVIGNTLQQIIAVAVTMVVAVLIGFRPTAEPRRMAWCARSRGDGDRRPHLAVRRLGHEGEERRNRE